MRQQSSAKAFAQKAFLMAITLIAVNGFSNASEASGAAMLNATQIMRMCDPAVQQKIEQKNAEQAKQNTSAALKLFLQGRVNPCSDALNRNSGMLNNMDSQLKGVTDPLVKGFLSGLMNAMMSQLQSKVTNMAGSYCGTLESQWQNQLTQTTNIFNLGVPGQPSGQDVFNQIVGDMR